MTVRIENFDSQGQPNDFETFSGAEELELVAKDLAISRYTREGRNGRLVFPMPQDNMTEKARIFTDVENK